MEERLAKPTLDIGEALLQACNNVIEFNGRSRRSEYWWTRFVVFIINIAATPFVGWIFNVAMIPLTFRRLHDGGHSGWWWGVGFLYKWLVLAYVIFDVIYWAVTTEADDAMVILLHLSKYALLFFIYVIYKVIFIVMLCNDSQLGKNRYGESPKYVSKD